MGEMMRGSRGAGEQGSEGGGKESNALRSSGLSFYTRSRVWEIVFRAVSQ